jgi:hypothetical protein
MTTVTLNETDQFFWDHAGWSYDPAAETSDHGKAFCAMSLASAERRLARADDCEVTWEDDPHPWDGDTEWNGPVYVAVLRKGDDVIGVLGGIAMESLDDPYRRVIEAELALEYFGS